MPQNKAEAPTVPNSGSCASTWKRFLRKGGLEQLPPQPRNYFPTTSGGGSALLIRRMSAQPLYRNALGAWRKDTMLKAHYYGVPRECLQFIPGFNENWLRGLLEQYADAGKEYEAK